MRTLSGLLAAAYPFLVFAGLRWLEPRVVALLLAATLLVRAALRARRPSRETLRRLIVPGVLVGSVLALALVANDERFLMFVPVLVNLALLAAFGRTLVNGPPIVETFARLQHEGLSPAELRHCRRVTWIWSAFFALNAAVVCALAAAGALWWWTVYTGGVAYALMGLLFGGEFVYRSWRFRRYEGTLAEPLFRWIFPREGAG
jgi:uncharacterized membrane protein